MGKLIPLKDGWREKLDELDGNKYADVRQIKNLLIILALFEILVEESNKKKSKRNDLQRISNLFFTHINQLGNSVFQLVTTGNSTSAIILSRAILENLIDFTYLWLCKKISDQKGLEREAWIHYTAVNRMNSYNKWKSYVDYMSKKGIGIETAEAYEHDDLNEQKLKEKLEDYDERFSVFQKDKKRFWAHHHTLDERARKVDDTGILESTINGFNLEEQYIIAYKRSSEFVHGASSIISGYVDREGKLKFGPNNLLSDFPMMMTNNYLLAFAVIYIQVARLQIDITNQLGFWGYTKKSD